MEQATSSELTPYLMGYILGHVALLVLLTAGILKCVSILGRESTNTKCVLSLAMVLGGLLEFEIARIATKVLSLAPPLLGLLALPGMLAILVGLVLAVQGLIEVARKKDGRYRGRGQAITTLVLGGVVAALFVAGFVGGALRAHRFARHEEQPTPGERLSFVKLNFEFETPPEPWTRLDAKKLNEDATLAFARHFPSVYFLVIAEDVGVGILTSEGMAELVKTRWQSVGEVGEVQERARTVDGVAGRYLSGEIRFGGNDVRYVGWAGVHNGFAYQLLTYGENKDTEAIEKAASELYGYFRILDRHQVASAKGAQALDDYRSERYGYEIELRDSPWGVWDDLAEDLPEADFGALAAPNRALAVIAYSLMGHEATVEEVAAALLENLDIEFDTAAFGMRKPIKEGENDGLLLHYERSMDGSDWHYVFKVLQANGFAYIVCAWELKALSDTAYASLEKELGRVRLDTAPPASFDASQLDEGERWHHALFFNELGGTKYRGKHYESAKAVYKTAFEFGPQDATILSNFVECCMRLSQYEEALAFVEGEGSELESDPEIRGLRALLLTRLNKVEEARALYQALFDEGGATMELLDEYVFILREQGEYEQALEVIKAFAKEAGSSDVVALQAQIYCDMGQYDEAIELLKKGQEQAPSNARLAYTLAETCLQGERYLDCIEACEQLIAGGNDTAYAHYIKGRAELDLDWYKEAKASFEIANRKEPADEDYARYLEYVSGLLGEGSNSMVKTPIEPVAIPEALLAAAPVDTTDAYYQGADACRLLSFSALRFKKGEPFATTVLRRVKVLSPSGVEENSSYHISFDPLYEEIYVNALKVLDDTGAVITEGQVSDYYVIDDTSDGMASQDKLLCIPVPGLKPGNTIELMYTTQDFSNSDTFPFTQYAFYPGSPTERISIYLSGDVGDVRALCPDGVSEEKTDGGLLWTGERPAVFQWEPRAASFLEYAPILSLAPRDGDWGAEVKGFLEEIAEPLKPDDRLAALAEKLVEGVESPEDRILALARHVQDEYTYQAIEFGRRAHVPNTVARIMRNKYGDCKDHSLLLHQLLGAIEVPSHLALVNAGGPVYADMPSVDQFNHMVVYVPELAGGRFVDCTDKDVDQALPVPLELEGKQALVIDPEKPRLVRIGEYPADSSVVECERTIRCADGVRVDVEERVVYSGYYASHMRGYLRGIDPQSRAMSIQSYLDPYGDAVRVNDLQAEYLDELEKPVTLTLEYTLRGAFHGDEILTLAKVPALWELWILAEDFVNERRTPFEVGYPLVLRSTSVLAPPDGRVLRRFDPIRAEGKSEFLSWSLSAVCEEPGAKITYEARWPGGTYPPEQYAEFVAQAEEASRAFDLNLAFERTAASE